MFSSQIQQNMGPLSSRALYVSDGELGFHASELTFYTKGYYFKWFCNQDLVLYRTDIFDIAVITWSKIQNNYHRSTYSLSFYFSKSSFWILTFAISLCGFKCMSDTLATLFLFYHTLSTSWDMKLVIATSQGIFWPAKVPLIHHLSPKIPFLC